MYRSKHLQANASAFSWMHVHDYFFAIDDTTTTTAFIVLLVYHRRQASVAISPRHHISRAILTSSLHTQPARQYYFYFVTQTTGVDDELPQKSAGRHAASSTPCAPRLSSKISYHAGACAEDYGLFETKTRRRSLSRAIPIPRPYYRLRARWRRVGGRR